jgi:hypothetical protein
MNEYIATGKEKEILVRSAGGENHVWHKVIGVCWHHDEDAEETQLVGFYVAGGAMRRAHVVIAGR